MKDTIICTKILKNEVACANKLSESLKDSINQLKHELEEAKTKTESQTGYFDKVNYLNECNIFLRQELKEVEAKLEIDTEHQRIKDDYHESLKYENDQLKEELKVTLGKLDGYKKAEMMLKNDNDNIKSTDR